MTNPNGYVSPFQEPGHDGPCHDMNFEPERPAGTAPVHWVHIRVVAYEGEGLTLAEGDLEFPPRDTAIFRADGNVIRVNAGDVKRALAGKLREFADELETQAGMTELDEGDA